MTNPDKLKRDLDELEKGEMGNECRPCKCGQQNT